MAFEPVLARDTNGRLEVIVQGGGQTTWRLTQLAANAGWGGWTDLHATSEDGPAVAQDADGRLEIFVRGADNSVTRIAQKSAGVW